MQVVIFLLSFLVTVSSCHNSGKNESEYSEENPIEGQIEEFYEDGTYCADVKYYNPNTGTENTYTLEVEVCNNEVTQINWNNGGWMDEDHFTAEQLDSDGSCSFTSDNGYEYTVTITGSNCDYTDEFIEENVPEDSYN